MSVPHLDIWVVGSSPSGATAHLRALGHRVRTLGPGEVNEALRTGSPGVVLCSDLAALPPLPPTVLAVAGDVADPSVTDRLATLARVLGGGDTIRLVDGFVDRDRGLVVRPHGVQRLTATELRLLCLLVDRAPEVVDREDILREVWGVRPETRTRTLSVTLARLRKKIEPPGAPVHLRSIYGSGCRFEPAPGPAPRHGNATRPLEPMAGRDGCVAAIVERLGPGRATTLVGPGGVGKTRLAREVAWAWSARGAAWVVDLEPASAPGDVVRAVATAVGVPIAEHGTARSAARAIAARLTPDALLVLDGVEHLRTALPDLLGPDALGRVALLLTSRVPVGLPAESRIEVEPLPAPDARRVLLDGIRRARGSEALSPTEEASVDALVERLDGLPLALGVAAARAGVLPLDRLLAHLDRIELLRLPGRAGDRHADLGACVAWSWDLLGRRERDALAAAAVFAGPFLLDALAAVLAVDPLEALDPLQALVEHRLVRRADGADARFVVPEVIGTAVRARAHLDPDALATRHARWHARLAERWLARHERGVPGPTGADVADLRTALAFAEARAPSWAGPLAVVLGTRLAVLGPAGEALEALDRAEALLGDGAADLRLHALHARTRAGWQAGRVAEAQDSARRAVVVARHLGDPERLVEALSNLGALHADRDQRRALLEEARSVLPEDAAPALRARVLHNLAVVTAEQDDLEAAIAHLEQALALLGAGAASPLARSARSNLGLFLLDRGDDARAAAALEEAVASARGAEDPFLLGRTLGFLGLARHAVGDLPGARAAYEEASALASATGDAGVGARADACLALLLCEVGAHNASERACQALARLPDAALPDDTAQVAALVAVVRRAVGDARGAAEARDLAVRTADAASPRARRRVAILGHGGVASDALLRVARRIDSAGTAS